MWYLIDTKNKKCLEKGTNEDIILHLKRFFAEFYFVTRAELEECTKYDLNRLLEVCGEWCSPKGVIQRYKIVNYEELEYYEVEVQNEE